MVVGRRIVSGPQNTSHAPQQAAQKSASFLRVTELGRHAQSTLLVKFVGPLYNFELVALPSCPLPLGASVF